MSTAEIVETLVHLKQPNESCPPGVRGNCDAIRSIYAKSSTGGPIDPLLTAAAQWLDGLLDELQAEQPAKEEKTDSESGQHHAATKKKK